jgi:hypothetical protein
VELIPFEFLAFENMPAFVFTVNTFPEPYLILNLWPERKNIQALRPGLALRPPPFLPV